MSDVIGERVTVVSMWEYSYQSIMCACGRWFHGRGKRSRIDEHYRRHARRCTSQRNYRKWLKANPPAFQGKPVSLAEVETGFGGMIVDADRGR